MGLTAIRQGSTSLGPFSKLTASTSWWEASASPKAVKVGSAAVGR